MSRSVTPLLRATRSRLPGGTEPVQKNTSNRNQSVRRGYAPLRASTLSYRFEDVALAKHASAFTQGNDLPWNPAKHYSVLKVLNKLPEAYHTRQGLSSNKERPFIPGLKAPLSVRYNSCRNHSRGASGSDHSCSSGKAGGAGHA